MEIPGQGGSPLSSPPVSPGSAAAAALANARWTPTKEQIEVLEGLYVQGLRTPTAEQIQQITARLREHGHIEGKNVFYWFQNHKARQRQKQKQQSFDYFAKLLRRPPPLPILHRAPFPAVPPPAISPPHPACNNAATAMYRPPCYMPAPQGAANATYYPHPQKPALYPMQHASTTMYLQPAPTSSTATPLHMQGFPPANANAGAADVGGGRQTLQLFPLQPTFALPAGAKARAGRAGGSSMATPTSSTSASFSGESESSGSPDGGKAPLPFYDFFGVHSGGR